MENRAITLTILVLFSVQISTYAKSSGGTSFNVLNYGAKPGKQESTQAFIKAWRAACDFNGKARLIIPPGVYTLGETVFEGPCKTNIPITILLQGTVQAVSDPSIYTDKKWISFEQVDGILLTGGGTIDGQGQNMWEYNDCKSNSNCMHLPASLYMVRANNTKIKGIHFVNSMGFHMHITRCSGITLHSLTITAPGDSPNTDGMHISNSNTVKVSRSVIRTGDDCISLGQGATNVTVNKITCGPGHGISVGSLGKIPNENDVRGLIVQNCTLQGTTNGLRIKTFAGSEPSRASGMLFQNIIMENVKNPIIIDQLYGSKPTDKPSQVQISDVFFMNIKGTSASPVAVEMTCSKSVPCRNVRLHNIDLKIKADGSEPKSSCINAKVGYSGLQSPKAC